jgi:hypothetical protein
MYIYKGETLFTLMLGQQSHDGELPYEEEFAFCGIFHQPLESTCEVSLRIKGKADPEGTYELADVLFQLNRRLS